MKLEKSLGPRVVEAGKELFYQMTVVPDALLYRDYAQAMHDATEGGLLGGIYEMAEASGVGVTVYEERIVIPEAVERICAYFQIDPLLAISEGTLVAAVPPEKVTELKKRPLSPNYRCSKSAEFTSRERLFIRRDGKKEPLYPVPEDPFWQAYFRAVMK